MICVSAGVVAILRVCLRKRAATTDYEGAKGFPGPVAALRSILVSMDTRYWNVIRLPITKPSPVNSRRVSVRPAIAL